LKSILLGGNPVALSEPKVSVFKNVQLSYRCAKPDEIQPGLWLGSLESSKDRIFLKSKNVKYVLSVIQQYSPYYPQEFTYHVLSVDDLPEEKLSGHFNTTNTFIEKGISEGGILVHCAAGVSRSATFVVAYLIWSKRINTETALAEVRAKREIVSPNPGFLSQLLEFQKQLGIQDPPQERQDRCSVS